MALDGNKGVNALVRSHRRLVEMFGVTPETAGDKLPTFSLGIILDDLSLKVSGLDESFPVDVWMILEPLAIAQNYLTSDQGGYDEAHWHDHTVPLPDEYHRPLPGETVLVAWLGPNLPVVLGIPRRYTS